MEAVGVVFSGGGRVYSVDPAGLELRWNDKVICQTAHGHELGRVVQENHELESAPKTPLKKVVRRATELDHEKASENKAEARRAMLVFRELVRRYGLALKWRLGSSRWSSALIPAAWPARSRRRRSAG